MLLARLACYIESRPKKIESRQKNLVPLGIKLKRAVDKSAPCHILEQLQWGDSFRLPPFVWVDADTKVGPMRRPKRTRIRLATHSRSNFEPDLRRRGHETDARAPTPLPGPTDRWQPPPFPPKTLPPARAHFCPTPGMDDDLDFDATSGLASLASFGKGKPRAPRKAAAPKPKKVLTPEHRAKESAKRKDWRHMADTRDEAIASAAAA